MGAGSNLSWFSRKGKGKRQRRECRRWGSEAISRGDGIVVRHPDVSGEAERTGAGKKWKYRLPKEAEWEYACRGAATDGGRVFVRFLFCQRDVRSVVEPGEFQQCISGGERKKRERPDRATKVGQYQPNRLGLYDMHGNVWQWCGDLYDNSGSERVIRGGSWSASARTAGGYRYRYVPAERFYDSGFGSPEFHRGAKAVPPRRARRAQETREASGSRASAARDQSRHADSATG